MGAKALYVDTARKIIAALKLANNLELLKGINKDKESYKKFAKDWPSANLDEFLEEHGISENSITVNDKKRKITFSKNGFDYDVVCAVGARYFRIVRKSHTDKTGGKNGNTYVGLDLKEPKLPKGLKGEAARAERDRLTHFRMTYRKKREK